jgi:hypothetical protein
LTSQIILGNFGGVVLASDTASTNTRSQAVTLNHHKIVDLGPRHRVVVSLASSLWQDGIPQTTVIRQWANSLGEPLVRLEDYAQSFRQWHEFGNLQNMELDSKANVVSCLSDHFGFIAELISESGVLFSDDDALAEVSDHIAEQTILEIVERGLAWLEGLPNYEGFSDKDAENAIQQLDVDVVREINRSLSPIPLTDHMIEVLIRSAPLTIARSQYMAGQSSDLHFVGYGSQDSTPAFIELSNRGTVLNRPMHFLAEPVRVGAGEEDFRFLVKHIAQDSAIEAFICGMDGNIAPQIRQYFDNHYTKSNAFVASGKSATDIDEAWNYADEKIKELTGERFVRRFLDFVTHSTVDRLAEAARTMIEIQKIRSESEMRATTVGGDVDVVKVTAYGVEWIRGRPAD